MRISSIANYNYKIYKNYKSYNINNATNVSTNTKPVCANSYNINFTSLQGVDNDFAKSHSTGFFRDMPTLTKSVEIIKNNFPEGGQILDYGVADGSEAITLYSIFNDDRYKIKGFDVNQDLINKAKVGYYEKDLDFLDDVNFCSPEETKHFRNFIKITQCPDDDCSFPTIFTNEFRLNKKAKNSIEYNCGDIRDIDTNTDKKAIAIYFRNALYHLTDNTDGICLRSPGVAMVSKNRSYEEKEKIIKEIADKIYDKLEVGGIFVIGDSAHENLYFAPKGTKKEDKVKISDLNYYQENLQLIEYACKATSMFTHTKLNGKTITAGSLLKFYQDLGSKYYLKKTPVEAILTKDDRFIPVYRSKVPYVAEELSFPTIFVKVK